MFINNLTGKTIKDISFEGFWFSIPVGISCCWDKFGQWILKDIYPTSASGSLPPVIQATFEHWDGKRFVDVRRFELNAALIPGRNDLYRIAKERGIPREVIEEWKDDEALDPKEIVKAINELDVPDYIKYPSHGESEAKVVDTKLPEDTDTDAPEPQDEEEKEKTPPSPTPPRAAATGRSPRTPRTPRTPAGK